MDKEAPRIDTVIPLPLNDDVLLEIVDKSRDWAIMHGAGMRSKSNFSKDVLQFAPFVLIPSAFPRTEFYKAVELQVILNELMHRVAHDRVFLAECLRETIQVDEFTGNLYKIYETIQDEGVTQPLSLGLIRSDIMLETSCPNPGKSCHRHPPYCCWKQVEINTIASGFGWLGPVSGAIHRFVMQELGYHDLLPNMPENNALEGLCSGMLEAWKIYGNNSAAILFVVEDVTYNICDQRFHEFELRRLNPHVKILRRTLTQIHQQGRLGSDNELIIDGHVVSVIYFRAGYEPGHYPTQKEWDARLMMERSQAIKSPSIHYHLAGTKKVQQALARPGAIELFLGEDSKIQAVKEIFTGLYSLDFDEFGDQAVQMAMDQPERFVMKPQREGGGNNIYGSEIRDAIMQMRNSKERSAWILMERIHPPVTAGYIVRPGGSDKPELVDLVSELGIYGVILGDSTKIYTNRQVGHMLRTKGSNANEGGVAAGVGALDSPFLID